MSSYYNQGVQVIVGNGQNFPGTPRISLIPFIQNAYDKGLLNFTVLPPGSISLAEIENIATSKILGRSTAGSGVIEQISIGTGLSLSGGTLSSTVTATPGGSDTQIQYNNAGVFGGSSQLIANIGATNTLDIQGSGSTSATNALRVRNSSGTELISFKNDGKIGIGISSATNPTIDAFVGFADAGTNANESGGLRLRSTTTDGNTRIIKLGISHTAVGGLNQGYGYIQFGYWGGSMNNPIVLQPLGGQVSIGQLAGLSDFSLISKGEVGIRANDDVAGNTIGGRISFLSQSGNGKSAFIAQIKEGASYYSSNGLIFATASGADISSSTGTERLRISGNGNISIGNVTPLAGLHNAINTTASTPSMLLSGTGYSGGTATTTKPTLLIEPTGTTSTGWSTSGTKLGVNAESGFTGNLFDAQNNGVSKVFVDYSGNLYFAGRLQGNSWRTASYYEFYQPISLSGATSGYYFNSLTLSGANTDQKFWDITTTINKTGTGSYSLIDANVTETSIPSGTNYIFNFKVNSVSQASLTNLGLFSIKGKTGSGWGSSYILGTQSTDAVINAYGNNTLQIYDRSNKSQENIPNAVLNVSSANKGFLPPRLTTAERDAVTWVAGDAGMMIFNTTLVKLQVWNGAAWETITSV